jgi:hypothetical protein
LRFTIFPRDPSAALRERSQIKIASPHPPG